MSIKAEVQGVALALFGAYAGAYLKDLTRQASEGSTLGVTGGLVMLQPALLAIDFASNDEWADHALKNLGVDAQNTAYTPAKVWFLLQLSLNRPKAEVVLEAVRFLLAIANGVINDRNYESIADAFESRVVQGIRWSEDTSTQGGAAIKALAELKAKADNFKPDPNNLQSNNVLPNVLADVMQAAQALNATGTGKPDDASIEAAEIQAESLIRDSLSDGSFVYNQVESLTGQTLANDLLEDAAQAAAQFQWNNIRQDYLSLVNQSVNDLNFMRQGASALVDAYVSQSVPLRASREALMQAESNLVNALSTPHASFPNGTVAYDYDVDSDSFQLIYVLNNGDELIATLAAGQWIDGPAVGAAPTLFKNLSELYITAWRDNQTRENNIAQVLSNLESLDPTLTSADTLASVDSRSFLTNEADFYMGATLALKEFDAMVNSAKDALNVVKQLRMGAGSNNLTALQQELQNAKNAVIAQGYNFESLRSGDQKTATVQGDIYDVLLLKGGANVAQIQGFGQAGDDGIWASGYTQATTATGLDTVLEYKAVQSGANVVLTFESVANGFAIDTAGSSAEFTVTLLGVSLASLSLIDELILG